MPYNIGIHSFLSLLRAIHGRFPHRNLPCLFSVFPIRCSFKSQKMSALVWLVEREFIQYKLPTVGWKYASLWKGQSLGKLDGSWRSYKSWNLHHDLCLHGYQLLSPFCSSGILSESHVTSLTPCNNSIKMVMEKDKMSKIQRL